MLLEKRPMPTFEPFIQKQRFPRGCPGWPERYGTAETQLINQRWGVLSERGTPGIPCLACNLDPYEHGWMDGCPSLIHPHPQQQVQMEN